MKLDAYDERVLQERGNAQDIMFRLYQKVISLSTAKKQLAGIRTHVRHKSTYGGTEEEIALIENAPQTLETDNLTGRQISTRLIRLTEEDTKSPTRILELHGYDSAKWILKKSRQTIWNGQQKNNVVPIELYSSRIEVEPTGLQITKDQIREIFESLTPPEVSKIEYKENRNCLIEPSILDFHLGKTLSLQEEIDLYQATVLEMIQKIKSYNLKPEKFLFQIGQDFVHIDNSNKTTTAGTPVETPSEWSSIYRNAVELLIWTVEHFRQLAPVDCFYVPGNHDKTLSFALAMNLNTYYTNCVDVIVDTIDFPRKYYKYGLNGIGMSHGREEGKRIYTKFQEEAPQILAETVYQEFHLGDLHHETVEEVGGILFRRTSSITDLDDWHITKGYEAVRKAPMYVWYPDGGKDIIDVLVKI